MKTDVIKNLWWGYRHINQTYQVKRYFDARDIQDARESPFCEIVVGPFEAENREDALKQVEKLVV